MVDSGLKRKIGEVFVRLLVLLILYFQVIIIFSIAIVLRHRVSSLRLVELNQPYLTLLVNFAGSSIVDIMKRGEISALIMGYLVIYNGIFLCLGFSLGIIRSRSLLLRLLHIRALLQVPALARIVSMHLIFLRRIPRCCYWYVMSPFS